MHCTVFEKEIYLENFILKSGELCWAPVVWEPLVIVWNGGELTTLSIPRYYQEVPSLVMAVEKAQNEGSNCLEMGVRWLLWEGRGGDIRYFF
jgi:hypothetical protein